MSCSVRVEQTAGDSIPDNVITTSCWLDVSSTARECELDVLSSRYHSTDTHYRSPVGSVRSLLYSTSFSFSDSAALDEKISKKRVFPSLTNCPHDLIL